MSQPHSIEIFHTILSPHSASPTAEISGCWDKDGRRLQPNHWYIICGNCCIHTVTLPGYRCASSSCCEKREDIEGVEEEGCR
jgi:hypothetical protein